MKERDHTDLWTALTIGAVVGIGAALLVRARQSDDDLSDVLQRLKPARKRADRVLKSARRGVTRRVHQAGEVGEDLADAGRDLLAELRDSARDIVQNTRDELEKAARDSIADARKVARKAARRTFR